MSSLKKASQKGFTLVELLIVIVVIGILAALVITTYSGIQQKGRNTERQTDLKAVQGQLEAYYASNGYYPSLANLNTQPGTGNWWIQDNMKGLDKEALRDPSTSTYQLVGSVPAAGTYGYSYAASPSGCDNGSGGNCIAYKLIGNKEGGGTVEYDSLN